MARKTRKSRKSAGSTFSVRRLFFWLMLAGMVGAWFKLQPDISRVLSDFSNRETRMAKLRHGVQEQLRRLGLKPMTMPGSQTTVVKIPGDVHPLVIYQRVSSVIDQLGGESQAQQNKKAGTLTFAYGSGSDLVEKVELVPDRSWKRKRGTIAIIIDDFGYKRNAVIDAFLDYPIPITYAIIPGLPKSEEIAKELHQRGKTIIIHLPMEPMQGRVENDGYTLFTHLKPDEIRDRVRKAIQAVPFAVGINNHMGSKATLDSTLLAAAFEEMAKAGYFFVDSRTHLQSIAFRLAQRMGLPALQNALFLDSVKDSASVAAKLQRLARVAEQNGEAVGIGHPRQQTLAALNQLMPELLARGFEFVTAEQLIRRMTATSNLKTAKY